MVKVELLARLLAKPGKEAEVISFLEGGLALVAAALMAQAPEHSLGVAPGGPDDHVWRLPAGDDPVPA
jgi:hypothetical protein